MVFHGNIGPSVEDGDRLPATWVDAIFTVTQVRWDPVDSRTLDSELVEISSLPPSDVNVGLEKTHELLVMCVS